MTTARRTWTDDETGTTHFDPSGLTYLIDENGKDRASIFRNVLLLDLPNGEVHSEGWKSFSAWLDKEGLREAFHASDDYGFDIGVMRAQYIAGEEQTLCLPL